MFQPNAQPDAQEKEYNTEVEYLEQNLLYLHSMHNTFLENLRQSDALIKELQDDLKRVKTPELKIFIENLIKKHTDLKKQALDIVKKSRKDLGFLNGIYKKIKRGN